MNPRMLLMVMQSVAGLAGPNVFGLDAPVRESREISQKYCIHCKSPHMTGKPFCSAVCCKAHHNQKTKLQLRNRHR